MSVQLINITPDAEKTMLFCARISNPKNQNSKNTKLLKYCLDNSHFSIFETAHMTIEIETSRAISAQILRHKSFSFQEFSQRYAEAQECIIYPARRQDLTNRQNSIDDLSDENKIWFEKTQRILNHRAIYLYKQALEKGIAKEQARFLLPMSVKTKLYMTGSIRSWIHYLQLRTANGTQVEHAEIAKAIQTIFAKELPVTSAALGWSNVS